MRKSLILAGALAIWLHAATAWAQFGQNQQTPPPGTQFLPRTGGGYLARQPPNPYGYGGYNNFNNVNGGNGAYGYNPFNNYYGNSNYNSPYGNPWQGNPWQANPWAGGGFNNPFQNPWTAGNNYGPAAPFGGYQTWGYGNYAPIVGVNNGWYPYQPAYDPNSPVNQALQRLYIQGLTGNLK